VPAAASTALPANNDSCRGVSGMDGYCSEALTCNFITPNLLRGPCADDSGCPADSPREGTTYRETAYCDTSQPVSLCKYVTPPAEMAGAWDPMGTNKNLLPWVRVKILMYSDPNAGYTPTLREWDVEYDCISAD